MAPSIGASGALFGVLAGYLGINIKNKIFSPAIIRELIFWIVFNIIIGLSIPNINMAAHAGGAIAGFIFTYFIRLNQYDVMKNLFRR